MKSDELRKLNERYNAKRQQVGALVARELGYAASVTENDNQAFFEEIDDYIEAWGMGPALVPGFEPKTPLQFRLTELHEIAERIRLAHDDI